MPVRVRLEDNFERFKSLHKTHLFRLALICIVFNVLYICVTFLSNFSCNYYVHLSFYF